MQAPAQAKMHIPAAALPDWIQVGATCVYTSKSRGDSHRVKIKSIEERKQTILFTFEQDKRIWKRVAFQEISRTGDSVLRPVWKEAPQVASCAGPPPEAQAEIEASKAGNSPAMGPAKRPGAEAAEVSDEEVVEAGSASKAKAAGGKRDRSRSREAPAAKKR